jgi:hypothetical protein
VHASRMPCQPSVSAILAGRQVQVKT